MKNKHSLPFLALTIIAIALFASSGGFKTTNYTRADELNERLQELSQASWAIHSSTCTLRGKLSEHYAKMDANPDLYEITGISTGCRSITVCRTPAFNSACVEMIVYIKRTHHIIGQTTAQMKLEQKDGKPSESENYPFSYEIEKEQVTITSCKYDEYWEYGV